MARNICQEQFKKSNPQIQWHDEVIQVKNDEIKTGDYHRVGDKQEFNIHKQASIISEANRMFEQNNNEKINKGTIEEQIQACTELEFVESKGNFNTALYTYRVLASMNPKLQSLYDKKFTELTSSTVNQ